MAINLDHVTEQITVTDTAANADLTLVSKGTGNVNLSTGNGTQFRVESSGSAATDFVMVGGSNTSRPFIRSASASGNIDLAVSSQGTGAVRLYTNFVGQEQARISHTASAVNYVQVTGAATGNIPTISAQGSDTNINFSHTTKGSGYHLFYSDNGASPQFSIARAASTVNYVEVIGAATGGRPTISSQGSDTNIDLAFTPKGTGNVRFGTYTGTILTPTGYVEIKDSGGTVRRLLVG
jgi:hypothetical protein